MLEIVYVGDMFEMLVTDFQHYRWISIFWFCHKVVATITSSWFLWYFEFRWCSSPDWPVPSISAGSKLGRPIGSHEIMLVHGILLRRSVYASIIGSYQLNWYKLFLAIFDQFRFKNGFDWSIEIWESVPDVYSILDI